MNNQAYLNRPNVKSILTKEFYKLLTTQSQNASRKIALCLDDFLLNFVENYTKLNHDWNQLDNSILYMTHEAFAFQGSSFYYRMFKKLIDNLIPSGIMKHLIENFYTKEQKFTKRKGGPKVLTILDLRFGFNIWLGCCLISIAIFIMELFTRLVKKRKTNNKIIKRDLEIVERDIIASHPNRYEDESSNSNLISKVDQITILNLNAQIEEKIIDSNNCKDIQCNKHENIISCNQINISEISKMNLESKLLTTENCDTESIITIAEHYDSENHDANKILLQDIEVYENTTVDSQISQNPKTLN